ncbi:MAG: response regulator [Candidatus Omnitrophota bacterium]
MAYKILIVDDDPEFRQEMQECLYNYKIIQACNGRQALEIIQRPHAVDLVILDVILPGLSGIEVLKQMKKIAPSLAVIILTGQSSKDVAIEALKGHADDYIEKPFQVEKLLNAVEKVLDLKFKKSTTHINKMERVKMFIERNVDKKIILKQVSEEVCLSVKYLSRLFKERIGVGFNEYRLKVKIQKAGEILKSTNYTVNQVAIQLGYKNPESFIRMFQKQMGCTPTQYRHKVIDQKRKRS